MSDISAPIPENEFDRVLKLSEYDIDYSDIHSKLNDLTRLAAYIAGTPISLVNLLDTNIQWTISNFGLDIKHTLRKETVCQFVILDDQPFEVEDMSNDERFKDKDYVLDDPHIRYYYGVPLTTPDGYRIGAMCVMDTDKHELTPEKQEFLKILANEVIARIEYEHKIKLMRSNIDELKEIQRKVSHDIRGPIGGIIGIAEILRDQAEESKLEEFMQLLELINKGGRSVLDLANEILSSYEEKTSENEISSHELNLKKLREKLYDLYIPQAKNKSIAFDVSIKTNAEHLTFKKYKLLQIFGNLITNALKFTPENGKVSVTLQVKGKSKPELIFMVEDNGVGMKENQIQAAKAYSSVSTKGTSNERGYGVGLKLACRLTDSLKGNLNIDSDGQKGTKITVKIPLYYPE